jgi:hypothetical protein
LLEAVGLVIIQPVFLYLLDKQHREENLPGQQRLGGQAEDDVHLFAEEVIVICSPKTVPDGVRLLWDNHTLLIENFSKSFRRIEMVELSVQ